MKFAIFTPLTPLSRSALLALATVAALPPLSAQGSAATATQLDATDYRVEWSSGSAKMTAILSVDLAQLDPNYADFHTTGPGTWLTGLKITATDGTVVSGPFTTLNDYRHGGIMYSGQTVFIGRELTSSEMQNMNFHWGSSGGSFNFHSNMNEMDVFSGSYPGSMQMSYFGPAFSGVTDVVTWMSSINNQNRIYAAGTTLASLPLEGAHHRPMMSFDRMGKDAQFWATGDFGSSSRVRDVKVTSGEMGVNKDIAPNTLAGIAIGRGQQNQDLALDGSNNVIGNYVLGEIDYRPFGSQWIVSLLGMVGSWDAKINRGYSNSGSTDYSLGQTDIISRSARLRVDAPVLFSVAGFGFSPYASYAVTQTVVEAYTEAGGALPASYDEQKHNATEARLGMMATKVINEKLKLIVSVEGIHRFDGAGPALTGQDITGSVGFSLPGQAPRPDCVRLGVDVDYKLAADTLLNISAHASTVGEVADVSGAVSIRRAF